MDRIARRGIAHFGLLALAPLCASAFTLGACLDSAASPSPGGLDASLDARGSGDGSPGSQDSGDASSPGVDGGVADAGGAADGGATTGALHFVYLVGTERDPLPDGGPPPSGVFGFTVDATSGAVAPFDTDGVTPGLQRYVAAGAEPAAAAATPDGKFIYVANSSSGDGSVSAFAVGAATGALTPIGKYADALSGGSPYALITDLSGKHLYVTKSSGASIVVFDIATDGSLTAQPTTAQTLVQPRGMAMSLSGDLLFVANEAADSTSSFKVDLTTGALSNRQSASTAVSPIGIVRHPTKKVVYTLAANSFVVYALAYDATGALTPLGSRPTGISPYTGTVDPSGAWLYVPNASDATINAYPLDPTTGALGAPVVSTVGVNANGGKGVTVDPGGKLLIVGGEGTPLLSTLSIGDAGALTRIPSSVPIGTAGFSNPLVIVR